ncbi:MAG: hypothetical protein WCS37_06965 [Chloroflexota bacterium]|nr:hypothetical protein [Chloroflexota bacterium]
MVDWHYNGHKPQDDAEFQALLENYLEDCQDEEARLIADPELDEETRGQELERLRQKLDGLHNLLARLRGQEVIGPEEARLRREIEEDARRGLIAMDTVYSVLRPDIHRLDQNEKGVVEGGILTFERKQGKLNLQIPLPGFDGVAAPDEEKREMALVAVTEVARAALGDYAARVMHLLFEVANDYPHWRTPNVTFSVNEFLDRLGYARDKRGIHYSKNRRYLMRTLVALNNTIVVAERPVYDKGKHYRAAVREALITSIRTIYSNDEEANAGLSTWELFEKGTPGDIIQVSIGQAWYEGVRRRDGSPGNNYTLVPRLGDPRSLANPGHSRTEDRMENYLYTRYKELKYSKLSIAIQRSTALDKAGVTTKNVTRATQILQKALDKLQVKGVITDYNPRPLPLRPNDSFTVELNELAFYQRRRSEEGSKK